MFLSMNWISDFVDFTGLDKKELIHRFSLSTADGYVKVPKSVELLDEGEEVEVYLFN